MTGKPLAAVRSFIIAIYGADLELRQEFELPVSIIAPVGNRIGRELIPNKMSVAKEPWYYIRALDAYSPPMDRTAGPEGPTSLCGRRYEPEREPPPQVVLHPEAPIEMFSFTILDLYDVLFRGVYTADDIFRAAAERLARIWIEKGKMEMEDKPFRYTVDISARNIRTIPEDLFPPEAFEVEGVFRLPLLSKTRKRFQFNKIPPPPFPVAAPEDYAVEQTAGRGGPCGNRVFMRRRVHEVLRGEIELSREVEMGGFLVGHVYRQPDGPENEDDPEFRWLVDITDIAPAEGAWGKPLALLFTGDTWSRVRKQIDVHYKGKELVSWFHTHLFKASDDFGLSGWDVDLHNRFMTRPWQAAVLVNIDADGGREIRCFQRGGDGNLVECTFGVVP